MASTFVANTENMKPKRIAGWFILATLYSLFFALQALEQGWLPALITWLGVLVLVGLVYLAIYLLTS